MAVDDFYQEFAKDLAAADLKYSGQQVELSFTRAKVEKDDRGRYFIAAGTGRYKLGVIVDQPGVFLYLKQENIKDFTGLKYDQPVTVRGRCQGSRAEPSLEPGFIITVEDCGIVRDR